MPNWKKIEERLINENKNITYDELVMFMKHYGFAEINKGKTSGSRVGFVDVNGKSFYLHKPHPQKEVDIKVIKLLHLFLEREGFINEK